MAKRKKHSTIAVRFPIKGLEKRWGFQGQGPFSTIDCDNIWPTQWSTGRERGGTRPGLTAVTPNIGIVNPLNWCEATWQVGGGASGIRRGVAIVGETSYRVSYAVAGKPNLHAIQSANLPPNDFRSCTVYLQYLFIASGGETQVKVFPLSDNPLQLATPNLTVGTYPDTEAHPRIGGTADSPVLAPKGVVPTNCGVIQTWGDRLVLAGDTEDPHIVYMCRVGAPDDWDYAAVDSGAAWANSGGSDGKIGEPITSLIPHNRDCLLVGCTDSLYVMRGNPNLKGQKYQLSQVVGPLMQSAWCKAGDDSTWMMTRDGLYLMRPGCGEPPIQVSREMLPEDLTAIDPGRGDYVSIGYDTRWRGIHIYAARASGTSFDELNYFYDIQSNGFWPMSFSSAPRLAVNFKSLSSVEKSGLVMVDANGTTRQFSADTNCERPSRLFYGPFALGDPFTEGMLSEIASVLANGSDNVKWRIYKGESPEQAKNDTNPFVGTEWNRQGLNYTQNPMVRATTCYVEVYNTGGKQWSMEEITMITQIAGRRTVG